MEETINIKRTILLSNKELLNRLGITTKEKAEIIVEQNYNETGIKISIEE